MLFSAPINPSLVGEHAVSTLQRFHHQPQTLANLRSFLAHPITHNILQLTPQILDSILCNDLYKPKMHNTFADYFPAINLEFGLNVRRSPISLADIQSSNPELWSEFETAIVERLANSKNPYPPSVVNALEKHTPGGFTIHPNTLTTASIAPIQWIQLPNGQLEAFTTSSKTKTAGPQAASHVETSLTQVVQEVLLSAQSSKGRISNEELLWNALARLALGVEYLNCNIKNDRVKIILFAGRRSSSRRFLLLQNWYCSLYLNNMVGTSSILVATLLPELAAEAKTAVMKHLKLWGTLSHEVPMSLAQLLPQYDELPVKGQDTPQIAQTTALLAHLLMLRSNGGIAGATALSDTFGTPGFISTALAARIPVEFCQDMEDCFPDEWATAPEILKSEKAVMFDIFRYWRMDSGDYEVMATKVIEAYKYRVKLLLENQVEEALLHPIKPVFMHSNLDSYEEVTAFANLKYEGIRPDFLCFGTLADGFLPFEFEEEEQSSSRNNVVPKSKAIQMSSIVMKVVQAQPSSNSKEKPLKTLPSAGKLGDDLSASKLQIDPRISESERDKVLLRLKEMARETDVDSEAASEALAAAYHAVTRSGIFFLS